MSSVAICVYSAVTSDIVAYAREYWGIQRAQAENLLREARAIIVDDINRERSEITAEMIHVCQTVIKNGMKSNQLNVVVGAINTISKLGGLEQAK